MKKSQLKSLLDAEVEELSKKSFSSLVEELRDVCIYKRGNDDNFHQFDVQLIEHEPDYIHVSVSIDDGSFFRWIAPLTRSFIIHRNGRTDK